MPPSRLTIQRAVLEVLQRGADSRLGKGRHYMAEAVREHLKGDPPSLGTLNEVLWSMLAQGLLHIDISQPAPENWAWRLSEAGRAALRDAEINPDDPAGYLGSVERKVPQLSAVSAMYLKEAVWCYVNRQYLASAVMLGVAAEASFLETARAFAAWLPPAEGAAFLTIINNPRQVYLAKFAEFRKRIEPRKPQLSEDFRDGMTLTMDAVLDVIAAKITS